MIYNIKFDFLDNMVLLSHLEEMIIVIYKANADLNRLVTSKEEKENVKEEIRVKKKRKIDSKFESFFKPIDDFEN